MQRASVFCSLAARSSLPKLLSPLSGTLLKHLSWDFAGVQGAGCVPGTRESLFLSIH